MFIIHNILKSYYRKNCYFKIYLEQDLVFYSVSFDELNANFVHSEEELYDDSIVGTPTFLIFQNPVDKNYQHFTDFKSEKLSKKTPYALLYYAYTGAYSTKSVTLVLNLELKNIVLKKGLKRVIKQ